MLFSEAALSPIETTMLLYKDFKFHALLAGMPNWWLCLIGEYAFRTKFSCILFQSHLRFVTQLDASSENNKPEGRGNLNLVHAVS